MYSDDSDDSLVESDYRFMKILEKNYSHPREKKKEREEEENKPSKMHSQKRKFRNVWNRSPIFKRTRQKIRERQLAKEVKNAALPSDFQKPSISKMAFFRPNLREKNEEKKNPQDQEVFTHRRAGKRNCIIANKLRNKGNHGSSKKISAETDTLFWHPSLYSSNKTIRDSDSEGVNDIEDGSEFSPKFTKGSDLQKNTPDYSFVNTRKRNISISEVDQIKSHERVSNKKTYSESKETTNPEVNSSVEISSRQIKPKPKMVSNKPARTSLTNEILKRVRKERALNLLESSKNDIERETKSQKTGYSELNSTDFIPEIHSSDEPPSLVDEPNFVAQRFHPFKNSILILSKEVESGKPSSHRKTFSCELETIEEDRSLLENSNLEREEKLKDASHILGEESNIYGKSFPRENENEIESMSFITNRRNFSPLKNLILSRDKSESENQSLKRNFSNSGFEGNLLDITNLKNSLETSSPILSRGGQISKRKQVHFLLEDEGMNITLRTGKSSKKRKMSLEGNTERNTKLEISEKLVSELGSTFKKYKRLLDRNIINKALESYIQNEFDSP